MDYLVSTFRRVLISIFGLTVFCAFAPASASPTYTADPDLSHFTAMVTSYAQFSNFQVSEGYSLDPYTPSLAEIQAGRRIWAGGSLPGLPNLPGGWMLATFQAPQSSFLLFPSIDNYGLQYDGYQYQLWGSNDGTQWDFIFDTQSVNECCEPFTIAAYTGTLPTFVNNVRANVGSVGYITRFDLPVGYKYLAMGSSSIAIAQGNADSEFVAIGGLKDGAPPPSPPITPPSSVQYTQITDPSYFTNQVTEYALFSNFNAADYGACCGGLSTTPYIPTVADIQAGHRIYAGGNLPGLNPNPGGWLLATFTQPQASIVLFPSLDHYGSQYDGYQYQLWGSNDGASWTFLFDAQSVYEGSEPFTLANFTGIRPVWVNNVPMSAGPSYAPLGYVARFDFPFPYKYYAIGSSSIAVYQGNADAELMAVGAVVSPIPPDNTEPEIHEEVDGQAGDAGWYRGDVHVKWHVSDPESPITSKSGCDDVYVTHDTVGEDYTCTATSLGGTGHKTIRIRRDTTPPVAVPSPTSVPNGRGWYRGRVIVHFTGTDDTSGIASCSADDVMETEGEGQTSHDGTCRDAAGNVSPPVHQSGINIDSTPPVSVGTVESVPNGAGWCRVPVKVHFTGSDGLSGVDPDGCSAPVTLTSEGRGQTVSGSCHDSAGNESSTSVVGINIDLTPPTCTGTFVTPPNPKGWHRSTPVVHFDGTDAMTGSGVRACSSDKSILGEGAGLTTTGSCVDWADNESNACTVTANVDMTAPSISVTLPAVGGLYMEGSAPLVAFVCTDALSGVDSCIGTVASGSALPTNAIGLKSFVVNALDRAGNSASVTVPYVIYPAPAKFTLTPALLNFSNQKVKTRSRPLISVLTNTGNIGFPIISILPDDSDFTVSSNCPAVLAPKGSCTITTVFVPSVVGAKASVVNFIFGIRGAAQLSLRGTGTK